jgi:FPC/CPF motif-containing protein YcgG
VLRSFVAYSRAHPKHRSVFIVFFEPDGRRHTLADDERRFWELLDWLHERDPNPWPDDVPTDPSDPHWEYCFASDPMFVFPCSPAYRLRLSRRMGPYYMVCFQPRRVFYGVESNSPAGQRARRRIWAKVRAWDPVQPHPELENMAYGDPEMREWKQYVLPDDNTPLLQRCRTDSMAGPRRVAAARRLAAGTRLQHARVAGGLGANDDRDDARRLLPASRRRLDDDPVLLHRVLALLGCLRDRGRRRADLAGPGRLLAERLCDLRRRTGRPRLDPPGRRPGSRAGRRVGRRGAAVREHEG